MPTEQEHCHGCGRHLSVVNHANDGNKLNVANKLNDVRYRSFHNFNQFHSQQQFAGKSRASWAVPVPLSSQVGPVFSSGFLAYPSEMDLAAHHDIGGWGCYFTLCHTLFLGKTVYFPGFYLATFCPLSLLSLHLFSCIFYSSGILYFYAFNKV